jgi:hypothetical protein
MKLNTIISLRPDFANTEYMNALQQEWHCHDFSVPPFSAEAAQKVSANSQEAPARANCGQVGNAGSVGQVEKDRAVM